MRGEYFILTMFLFLLISCDVSSVEEAPCENFFSCNEGVYEGDGEEGGIIDRYVIKLGEDLVVESENGGRDDVLIILYYKFEDHPAFTNNCFNESSFRKVEYFVDHNSEEKLEISSRANGTSSSFEIEDNQIRWKNSESTIFLRQSDLDLDDLNTCQ